MGSYTPLDLDRFKEQSTTSQSSSSLESSFSAGNAPPPRRNPAFPYMIVASFVVAVISGIFYMQLMFQNNLRATQSSEYQGAAPHGQQKIIIGSDTTFPPMEFVDENGNLAGFGIDLMKMIGEEMGVEVEHRDIPWDQVFDELEAGNIDMVISSVTITDERKQKYDFSAPYLNAGQVIITKKTTTDIRTPDDLWDKRVAVQKGTTNEIEGEKYVSPETIQRYEVFTDEVVAVLEDKADALISDLPGAKGIINEHPELMISSDPFTEEYYGIVFRKDQKDLVQRINNALEQLRQKGILSSLKEKWLN